MDTAIRLAVFDMDGVLIESYSSWVLVHRHFGTNNEDSLRAFLNGEIDDFEFIRRDVERWSQARGSVPLREVRQILDAAPLVPGAIDTLLTLKERGLVTAIVSGGLRYLAERIGALGAVDHVHANDVQVDEMGCLTGGGIVNVPLKEKGTVVSAIQEGLGIGPERTAVVGDTAVDVSMFRHARVSIAFNPGDEVVEGAASAVVRARDLTAVLPIILDGS